MSKTCQNAILYERNCPVSTTFTMVDSGFARCTPRDNSTVIGKNQRRKLEHHEGRWRHWLFLALTVFLLCLVATFVDLKPHVDENFFFSSSDPRAQESDKIDRIFGGEQPVDSGRSCTRYLIAGIHGAPRAIDETARLRPVDR